MIPAATFLPILGLDPPMRETGERELCAMIHVERIGAEIIVRQDLSFTSPWSAWPVRVSRTARDLKASVAMRGALPSLDDMVRTILARVDPEMPVRIVRRPTCDRDAIFAMEERGGLSFAQYAGLDILRGELAEGRGDRFDALLAAVTELTKPPPARWTP